MAMPPKRITAEEKALLPAYCKYTQGGYVGHENPQQPSAQAKHWVNVFGGQGISAHHWRMHHYCYALIHMMRGQRSGLTLMEYRGAWQDVIGETDYLLQFFPSDFVLMPEILLNRGRAFLRLKKSGTALDNFQKAIELKPDYWPPYLEIANHYAEEGDKAKAIDMLLKGLQHAPNAKGLRIRLKELGGELPPEPAPTQPDSFVPPPSQVQ